MSGILSIIGTPIGNLDDLSPRAAKALADADVIACEDTRVAKTLLTRADSRARLLAVHARNEEGRAPEVVRLIRDGARVVLTTDAGMPGISDPGHKVVEAVIDAGLRMEVIPGPSAVPAALILSGLPTARFVFEGFLPRTGSSRRKRIQVLAAEERTIVLFESPHRIEATVADLLEGMGDRRIALARELTKIHEEVIRGTMAELLEKLRERPARGECTLVIEGAAVEDHTPDDEVLGRAVADLVEAGVSRRDAVEEVADRYGISKQRAYRAALAGDEAD